MFVQIVVRKSRMEQNSVRLVVNRVQQEKR